MPLCCKIKGWQYYVCPRNIFLNYFCLWNQKSGNYCLRKQSLLQSCWNSEINVLQCWRKEVIRETRLQSSGPFLYVIHTGKNIFYSQIGGAKSLTSMHISFLQQSSKLPQTKQLKTTLTYYLTVSVGQESRFCLAGSSPQDLTRL